MKKRGQALVEFIIILPVFLLLLLGIIDIGKIFYNKTILESTMNDVIQSYRNGKSIAEITQNLDNTSLVIDNNDGKINFILKQDIEIITPGLNLIFDNPYELVVSRNVYDE